MGEYTESVIMISSQGLTKVITPRKTATDGVGLTPDPARGGAGMMIMPNIVTTNNPQSYVEQNISAVPITNFAKPNGVGIGLVK